MSAVRVGGSIERAFRRRAKRRVVREIEHSSIDRAFFSCGQIRLRVKAHLKFGCTIGLINKRRSFTELNSDSRPSNRIVETNRRQASRTIGFCGVLPATQARPASGGKSAEAELPGSPSPRQSAGTVPAPPYACTPRTVVCAPALLPAHRFARLRATEFISVSGNCPERSALHSDLRLKRNSGFVAAPALPHAPMNGPDASRVGFFLSNSAC